MQHITRNYNTNRRLDLLKKLNSFQYELDDNGIKCWLDFGQLLGAKRENELLSWDNDIDFTILLTDFHSKQKIEKIKQKYFKSGFGPSLPNIFDNFNENGFRIDIFYGHLHQKYIKYTMGKQGGFNMRSFFVDELEETELNGYKFKCPRHLELYLKIRYGENWKIPIKMDNSRSYVNLGNEYQNKQFHCITAGVFDLLHEGHKKLFMRAKNEFDILTIVTHNDKEVEEYKRKPIDNQDIRYEKIVNLGVADYVHQDFPLILDDKTIENYDFVIFGREDNMEKYYPINEKNHPVERTENISTSKMVENKNT